MRGQLSLEFLIVLAAYLAFLSVLIGAQLHFMGSRDANVTSYVNARQLSVLMSEQLINNQYLSIPLSIPNCIVTADVATCGKGNKSVTFPFSYTGGSKNAEYPLS